MADDLGRLQAALYFGLESSRQAHGPALLDAVALQRQLLHPHWRMLPMQYDLPANCQVFGRLASAAGLHALRYPSARHEGRQCLVLFPQNWGGSAFFVEVADAVPPEARLVRLDATTGAAE